MGRPWLALLLLATISQSDEVDDERARNDALLEARHDELLQIPIGHFVVVVGGDTLASGKELDPLLKTTDPSPSCPKTQPRRRRPSHPGGPVVVLQNPAEPFATLDVAASTGVGFCDPFVAESLVRSLRARPSESGDQVLRCGASHAE